MTEPDELTKQVIHDVGRRVIAAHYANELEIFDALWKAAADQVIASINQEPKEATGLVVRLGLGLAEAVDWASPVVIATLCAVTVRLPLRKAREYSAEDIQDVVRELAAYYGAPRLLSEHLASTALQLYRGPFDLVTPDPRVEVLHVLLRKRGAPEARPVTLTLPQVERLRLSPGDHDIFIDLARIDVLPHIRKRQLKGLQPKQRQFLAFVISRFGRTCTHDEIYEGVWLSKPDRYGARGASGKERVNRLWRQKREIARVFKLHGIEDPIEAAHGGYLFRGVDGFCIIPDDRPTLMHESRIPDPSDNRE